MAPASSSSSHSRSRTAFARLRGALAGMLASTAARTDLVVAAIVVAIVLALIVPMPAGLLDVCIAVNLCISAFLVILALQIAEPVELTTYPVLLLMTTLLRVALSVASTRLILLDAHAGSIIEAFGEVAVGGNLVVGIVVFLILTVVQFLVITKGSERVAEVGARFTLDALPGKQMSIDMDLRNGALTADQARIKRARLGQESQFFGAMDGAMKFVKGDAIAGIIILLTNLIAGICIGVLQREMPMSEALQLYSVLTIGDGLVAQLPALLSSLTAGFMVTRVANAASDGPRNLGQEMFEQVQASPRAWIAASGAMAVFGFIPGMPVAIFLVLSAGSFGVGCWLAVRKAHPPGRRAEDGILPTLSDYTAISHYEILFRSNSIEDTDVKLGVINLARTLRNQMVEAQGVDLPPVNANAKPHVEPGWCYFNVDGVLAFRIALYEKRLAVELPRDRLLERCRGLGDVSRPDAIEEERIEFTSRMRCWVDPGLRETLEAAGIAHESGEALLARRIDSVLQRTGWRYFGLQEASAIAKRLLAPYPDVLKELERVMPYAKLAEVMQRLIAEQINIRHFRRIAETLIEWAPRERDATLLSECVRVALRRQICQGVMRDFSVHAIVLRPETESDIRDSVRQTSYGTFSSLGWEEVEQLSRQLEAMLDAAAGSGHRPVVLCAQDVRPHLRKMFEERFFETPIVSINELVPECRVVTLGLLGDGGGGLQGHEDPMEDDDD